MLKLNAHKNKYYDETQTPCDLPL